jgi:hypothetical protein
VTAGGAPIIGSPRLRSTQINPARRGAPCRISGAALPRHKFKIGQRLFLVRSIGSSVPGGAYVVIKRLPKRDSEFEYQIKSVNNEVDERVVRESELRTNPWRKTTL